MEVSLDTWASLGTALATIALVFLLWKTIKQFEGQVALSRIQTEYRFRPWIGPISGIKKMEHSINEKCQFDVGIKNYGEIPAEGVKAKFIIREKIITKDEIKAQDKGAFDMGPLLPNMEKHYWFFVEPDLWQKAEEGKTELFTAIYFEYSVSGSSNGYGMISQYIPSAKNFIHKEMWIDGTHTN